MMKASNLHNHKLPPATRIPTKVQNDIKDAVKEDPHLKTTDLVEGLCYYMYHTYTMKFDYDYTALYSNDVRIQNNIIHVYECEATPRIDSALYALNLLLLSHLCREGNRIYAQCYSPCSSQ